MLLLMVLTIDASALTTVATIDATEEDDGKLTIITGSGDDVVTADVSANFKVIFYQGWYQ